MDYTLAVSEVLGDIFFLHSVAVGMAKRSANAGNKGFHQPAYDRALPKYISDLVTAARTGKLQVCNQQGTSGTPKEIINHRKREGPIVELKSDPNLTIALNVFVSIYQLNLWAKERGDIFHITHEGAPWIDERGWNNLVGLEPPLEMDARPFERQECLADTEFQFIEDAPVGAATVKPLQRGAAQETLILSEIKKLGYDTLALPKNLPGKPGVKSAIRKALQNDKLFTGKTIFDKAWERLAASGDIVIKP